MDKCFGPLTSLERELGGPSMVTPRTKIFAARLLISLLLMMIGTVALAAGGFPQTQDHEDLLASTTGEKAVSASGYDFFLVTDNANHSS